MKAKQKPRLRQSINKIDKKNMALGQRRAPSDLVHLLDFSAFESLHATRARHVQIFRNTSKGGRNIPDEGG